MEKISMNTKITCPVCDRPEIEGNICPNCETDLSLVRMLVELPEQKQQLPIIIKESLSISVAIFLIIIGISFGVFGREILLPKPIIPVNNYNQNSIKNQDIKENNCLSVSTEYLDQKNLEIKLILDTDTLKKCQNIQK
jgi:hypothetical protein